MITFITCSSGTLLTLARLSNKKLLNEIYYNTFKRKSDTDYIAYNIKYSKIENIRMPLAISMVGEEINTESGLFYYGDLYRNITFMVYIK
jgi:hypothetical protein